MTPEQMRAIPSYADGQPAATGPAATFVPVGYGPQVLILNTGLWPINYRLSPGSEPASASDAVVLPGEMGTLVKTSPAPAVVSLFSAYGESTARLLSGAPFVYNAFNSIRGGMGPNGSVLPADSRRRTMVLLGDSITDYNFQSYDVSGALWTTYDGRGYFNWANAILKDAYLVINEAGVGGDTSASLLARLETGVFAFAPDECFMLIGHNDIANGVLTAAEIKTNLANLYSQITGRGIRLRTATILPSTSINTDAELSKWQDVNEWIVRNASSYGVRVCDWVPAWASATDGAPAAGMSFDGVHPAYAGAFALGRVLAASILPEVGLPPSINTTATLKKNVKNLMRNPYLWGDNASGANGFVNAAGFTGQGPNDWTNTRTGTGSGVCSKQNRGGGIQGQYYRIVATIPALGNFVGARQDVNFIAWASGAGASLDRVVRPTVPNGCAYRVITAGSFAVGTDPTATWPTVLGTSFAAGTANLLVIDGCDAGDWYQAKVRVKFSALTGTYNPRFEVVQYTASYASTLAKSTGLLHDETSAMQSEVPADEIIITTPEFQIFAGCMNLAVAIGAVGAAGAVVTVDVAEISLTKAPNHLAFAV